MSDDELEHQSQAMVHGGLRPAPGTSEPADASAVNHLVLNCIVPGLGSLLRGRSRLGAGQLGLSGVGVALLLLGHWGLGPALVLGAWIWSVASGVGFLRERRLRW
ncbi:MAG: hypothetical protein RMK29_13075 [Myxococcales bacterium]|nr:hypothetical protein [Myxococcota bacterium]MDW8282638.1 hypothetical protein [Myxococcales bacterium]